MTNMKHMNRVTPDSEQDTYVCGLFPSSIAMNQRRPVSAGMLGQQPFDN
jgi:hypothetical protein